MNEYIENIIEKIWIKNLVNKTIATSSFGSPNQTTLPSQASSTPVTVTSVEHTPKSIIYKISIGGNQTHYSDSRKNE